MGTFRRAAKHTVLACAGRTSLRRTGAASIRVASLGSLCNSHEGRLHKYTSGRHRKVSIRLVMIRFDPVESDSSSLSVRTQHSA
jgi:hypothetical protein